MPLPLLAKSALISGGSSLAKYAYNRWLRPKQKAFQDTDYARRLKQISQQGIYSPQAQQTMLSNVGRTAGGIMANQQSYYRGRMANMGQSGSIAAQRGMNQFGTQLSDIIAREQSRINLQNEMSKSQALTEYARKKTGYEQELQQEKQQQADELMGGLISAGGGYLQGLAQQGILGNIKDVPVLAEKFRTGEIDKDELMAGLYNIQGMSKGKLTDGAIERILNTLEQDKIKR